MTTMYSQFFSYWTTAADLTVYGAFEPFLHLALSLAFLILILFNNALALEAMVTNCVNTLDSLSDNASRKAIVRVTTLLLALCSFILNNQLGFATVVTIENTVIPLATAVVVLLELLVVGALYGFERVYANVLSMSSHKILQTIGKMRNVGTLLSPEYELWGPKMTDDRRKAAVMEKKVRQYVDFSHLCIANRKNSLLFSCKSGLTGKELGAKNPNLKEKLTLYGPVYTYIAGRRDLHGAMRPSCRAGSDDDEYLELPATRSSDYICVLALT
ncbi:unnamed protein product [Heligmosomoides polygyrus]|uniref:DUF599 domain-containing protein n=1 Tax=Heligmosomoides polygyrus TaxID=6339 RepID=A0A3P8DGY4_HELPZ|nr:unnamed protein product [Heligmosomoides polygyrus]